MAGGDVDCTLNLAAANFKGNRGCGSFAAEEHRTAVVDQYGGGGAGELGREEARVVTDEERRFFRKAANVRGDCRGCDADAVEGEIVGDDAAPTGGAEMDGVARHADRIVSCRARIEHWEKRVEREITG